MERTKALQVFEQYLSRRYGDRSTPKHYLSDMRIFFSHLDKRPIRQVTAQDIDGFIDMQHEHQLAPTTIDRCLATLHTFFEYMASLQPDTRWPNPVNWRRHRLKEAQLLPRDASDQEVEQLFAVIDVARGAAIFGLMVGAGLRVEEVTALRVTDLDAAASPEQMARLRVRGKGHKERIVWITPRWYSYVQAWLVECPAAADAH